MPAGLAHGVEQELAQLVGQLRQLGLVEFAQVGGKCHVIEQRRRRARHGNFLKQLHSWGFPAGMPVCFRPFKGVILTHPAEYP